MECEAGVRVGAGAQRHSDSDPAVAARMLVLQVRETAQEQAAVAGAVVCTSSLLWRWQRAGAAAPPPRRPLMECEAGANQPVVRPRCAAGSDSSGAGD